MSLSNSDIVIDLAQSPRLWITQLQPAAWETTTSSFARRTALAFDDVFFLRISSGQDNHASNNFIGRNRETENRLLTCVRIGANSLLMLAALCLLCVAWYLAALTPNYIVLFCVHLLLSLILFLLIHAITFITNASCFAFEETLTVSSTALTLHKKRFGLFNSDLVFPLSELVSFSTQNKSVSVGPRIRGCCLEVSPASRRLIRSFVAKTAGHALLLHVSADKNPHDAQVPFLPDVPNTTGGAPLLGISPMAYRNQYGATVSYLNQFLIHARERNQTPTPCTPLRELAENRFRLTRESPTVTDVPFLSRLSFLEIDETSFKCVNRRQFPIFSVLPFIIMFSFWNVSVLISIRITPNSSLSVFVKHPLIVIANIAYVVIGFLVYRFMYMPSTWIFSRDDLPPSRIRSALRRLRHVHHVPVTRYSRVEVEKYKGRSIHGFENYRRTSVQWDCSTWGVDAETLDFADFADMPECDMFKVHFLGVEGEEQCIPEFTEGEILCLTGWLQQRFPHLFEYYSHENVEGDVESNFEQARTSLREIEFQSVV